MERVKSANRLVAGDEADADENQIEGSVDDRDCIMDWKLKLANDEGWEADASACADQFPKTKFEPSISGWDR